MRVGLLCEVLHPPLDEGIRLYAAGLARALACRHEVLLISEKDGVVGGTRVHGVLTNRWFLSGRLSRLLRSFEPEVLIYVPWTGLTSRTLVRVQSLRRYARGARLGLVALQPRRVGLLMRGVAGLGGPDSVMAVGPGAERQARALGLPSARVPAGVDAERFRPATSEERAGLRGRLRLDAGSYVVLHVGHLKRSRNVDVLEKIARIENVACLMVCSSSTTAEQDLRRRLEAAAVKVVGGHQDRIEDLYRVADAYLFPVTSELDAIEAPLSVLEAAACDLEILATPFGGLPDLIGTGGAGGVTWVRSEEEMVSAVERLSRTRDGGPPASGTRARVMKLGWERVADSVLSNLAGDLGAVG